MEKPALELVSKKLDEIEAEMRKIGFWSDEELDIDPKDCKETYCADKITFSQWLQYVFVPSMRFAVETNTLPIQSLVTEGAMGEWNELSVNREAFQLILLITEFDDLINIEARKVNPL
ncbi:hypothetical protein BH11PAT2_BH11PAT2_06110 [soil metagenome]